MMIMSESRGVLVVQAAGKGRVRQDQRVPLGVVGDVLGKRVTVADVRVLHSVLAMPPDQKASQILSILFLRSPVITFGSRPSDERARPLR
jgi:hypothetical protein